MPKPRSVRDWATGVKLRFDAVVSRYYSLRGQVHNAARVREPDCQNRHGDPRADMLSIGGRIEEFCKLMERYRPERGDELDMRLREGPQPKERGL